MLPFCTAGPRPAAERGDDDGRSDRLAALVRTCVTCRARRTAARTGASSSTTTANNADGDDARVAWSAPTLPRVRARRRYESDGAKDDHNGPSRRSDARPAVRRASRLCRANATDGSDATASPSRRPALSYGRHGCSRHGRRTGGSRWYSTTDAPSPVRARLCACGVSPSSGACSVRTCSSRTPPPCYGGVSASDAHIAYGIAAAVSRPRQSAQPGGPRTWCSDGRAHGTDGSGRRHAPPSPSSHATYARFGSSRRASCDGATAAAASTPSSR